MTDRSELALQLTDAIVAKTAAERAGDRAFRAYGLSHRAQAALVAVDLGGPDGACPKEIATQLRVSRTRRGLEVLLRAGQLERRLAARAIEGLPASSIARAVHLLEEFKQRLEEKQIGVVR